MTLVQLAAPFAMNNATLTIGTDSFEVSSAKFAPAPSIGKIPTIGGRTIKVAGSSDWTLAVGFGQDLKSANSLSKYLHANEGDVVTAVLSPQGAAVGDPTVTAEVTLVPGEIGGDANAPAMTTVTLEVNGAPVLGTVAV